MLKPINVNLQDNLIIFRYEGSDDIIYKTKRNTFVEDSGVTISNPAQDIPAYIISLDVYGTNIECGHIIDNIVGYLQGEELENIFLVIDFKNVVSVSNSFIERYVNFILSTKSKTISINQNTNINNLLSQYIESFIDIQEVS